MGRGNWIPDTPIYHGDYNLVYVDLGFDLGKEHDQDDIEFAYNDLKEAIAEALPTSFGPVGRGDRLHFYKHDSACIFANQLLMVVWDTEGDHWHQGLAVVAREDTPAFAQSQIDRVAEKLWKKLHERYKLYRRACAWTCHPYVPA